MDNERNNSQTKLPFNHRGNELIRVELPEQFGGSQKPTLQFSTSFTLGRDSSCDVKQLGEVVSHRHAEIFFDGVTWCIRDLNSTNGTYINEVRIEQSRITQRIKVKLGKTSPHIWLEPIVNSSSLDDVEHESVAKFVERQLDPKNGLMDSETADAISKAFERILQKKFRVYRSAFVAVLLLFAVLISTILYQQFKINKLRNTATDIFYTMKSLEMNVLEQDRKDAELGRTQDFLAIKQKQNKLKELKAQYEYYRDQTNTPGQHLDPEDRLIFQVARTFGESELTMPKSFVLEVKKYIRKWQSTPRFRLSISRSEIYNFVPVIKKAMSKNHLPVQYYYLGLQESGFRLDAVGPETRHGIAKGPWQFIPNTAVRYGLKTGPLFKKRVYDSKDERHDIFKSTDAAARYLKYIYSTKAQASGLLTIASYNWGEHRIEKLLKKMPKNPRQRNFWALIKKYKIPSETYDYVLSIFSAAVIGENPRLFGFDFDNPLEDNNHS